MTCRPANAQNSIAPPTATAAGDNTAREDQGDIVVTGSRISGTGFQTPTPVTSLSADDLGNAAVSSVGQIIAQLPGVRASTNPASTTLASQNAGAATFDLRGLGAVRTLVLVNGRRVAPTTTNATVDTNVIPSALIDRVDIVTGGASAAYGSDAISGVVNLILKKNIDGIVGTFQGGVSSRGDYGNYLGSLGWGTSFQDERGHFSIALEGARNHGILSQRDRAWSARAPGLISNPAYTANNGQYRQYIADDFQLATATTGGLITSGNLRGTQFLAGGGTAPFIYGQYAATYQIGGGGVNAGDYTAISVPTSRYSIYSIGDYDFGGVEAFYEASYAFSEGVNPNLVTPFHLGSIRIQRDNAYLPASVAAAMTSTSFMMGRFSTDLAPITADDSNRATRIVTGFKGELGGDWKWNIYGEYGHTRYHSLLANNIDTAKFTRSVDAVRNSAGDIACRANLTTTTAPGCVAVNLFGSGSVLTTPGAVAYFTGTTDYEVNIDERIASGNVQGSLFDFNGRPVTIATGLEYRHEAVAGTSDAVSQAAGWLIGNPQPLKGSYDIKEAFGEIELPLLHDLPFARNLGLNGAVRITDYSTSGTVVTWKGGANWEITDDIRVRLTRSRDIRAPNFDELFTNSLYRFATVTDPARNNQQLSVTTISQGNVNLKPEIANTFTAGIILTPRVIKGLRVSLDYYDIRIRDAITTLASQDLINRCYNGNSSLCSALTRDSAGTLTSVNIQYINLSKIRSRGADLELAYRLPLSTFGGNGDGALTFRALTTYVNDLIFNDGVTSINRAGDVGYSNGGMPHWKFNASVTYENGPMTLFVQDRYVGGGKYNVTFGQYDLFNNDIASRNYVDATVTFNIAGNGPRAAQIFFNVTNLLDRTPPADPINFFAPAATNAQQYDVVGRQFKAGFRFSL